MQRPTAANLRIRSTQDAHLLFYAVALGVLPRIMRRLDAKERKLVTSGAVYVWEEGAAESASSAASMNAIARWTDGLKWGPSRVRDDFLFYHEKDVEGDDSEAAEGGSGTQANRPPGDSLYRSRHIPGPERLVKQTYSVHYTPQDAPDNAPRKWHLTAYYTQATVERLGTIDDIPKVGGLEVPEGMFRRARMPSKGGRRDDSVGRHTVLPQRARSSSRNVGSPTSATSSSPTNIPSGPGTSPPIAYPLYAPFVNTPPSQEDRTTRPGGRVYSGGSLTSVEMQQEPTTTSLQALPHERQAPTVSSLEHQESPPWQFPPPAQSRSQSRSPQIQQRYTPYPNPPLSAQGQGQGAYYGAVGEAYHQYPQPSTYSQTVPAPQTTQYPTALSPMKSLTANSPSRAGSSGEHAKSSPSPPSSQPFSSPAVFGSPFSQGSPQGYSQGAASPIYAASSPSSPYPTQHPYPSASIDQAMPSHEEQQQQPYNYSQQYSGQHPSPSPQWPSTTGQQEWSDQQQIEGLQSAAQGLASLANYQPPGSSQSTSKSHALAPVARGRSGIGSRVPRETAATGPGRDPMDEKTLRTFNTL